MSYMVLARRWRPREFSELVGQEHVQRALINALDGDRLHHAFLFTGTRGVGKTTIARILAKCLNCEKGVSSRPCGECAACTEIDEGRFVDLIEVDAASRTKVDDTRELLENVQYSPTRGRYKVYLIDEVHMLSAHSFNALLKTLEEPPPHVKFLLATTDPQKLPVTVLSRCLQFNLKRLSITLIQGQLEKILSAENIKFEATGLALLARAADGSMRDALSLMDQAISYGDGKITEDDVRAMLGTIDKRHVYELLNGLAEGDVQAVLEKARQLDELAPDYEIVLADLAEVLHKVAVLQAVPDISSEDSQEQDAVARLARSMDRETVQLFYQIALIGKRDLPLAPDPQSGFEMVLLRLHAFEPVVPGPGGDEVQRPASKKAAPKAKGRRAAPPPAASAPHAAGDTVVKSPEGWREPDWLQLVDELPVQGAAKQLAANCAYLSRDGDTIKLVLEATHEHLLMDKMQKRLGDALSAHFGERLRLRVELGKPAAETPAQVLVRKADEKQASARDAIEKDPNVSALMEAFDAEIQPESVKPVV